LATTESKQALAGGPPAPSKNRNLIERVATALVLLPVVLALMYVGGLPFAALAAVAAVLNAVEFSAMAMGEDPLRVPAALGALAMPFFFVAGGPGEQHLHWLWAAVVLGALTMRLFRDAAVDGAGAQVAYATFAAVYGSLVGYVVPLRELGAASSWAGAGWVLLACALTWGGDTGAYFAGRFLGRHKLYPRISPAKTWEGFAGGMATSVGMAFGVRAFALDALTTTDCLALGVLGGLAGPAGDLVESMIKRSFGVKDSGQILPGHGGMLDRVDALMFNAPVVYLYAKTVVLARP
jgi:phosphatidate cytidylyltransferase